MDRGDLGHNWNSRSLCSKSHKNLTIRIVSVVVQTENIADFKVETPSSSPFTVAPGRVAGLMPPLAQKLPVLEVRVRLTVEKHARAIVVDAARDDDVPGAVGAVGYYIQLRVLKGVWITESGHIINGRGRDDWFSVELGEFVTAVMRDGY